MATATGAAGIDSDDFAGAEWNAAQPPSGGFWTWSVPGGACTLTHDGYQTSNAGVIITVPSGATRSWYSGARSAPALHQPCTDSNFTIQTKLETIPNANGKEVYLYVASASEAAAYGIGFYYDTTLNLSARNCVGGSEPYDADSTLTAPCYLRLTWNTSANTLACEARQSDSGWGSPQHSFTGLSSFVPTMVGLFVGTFSPEPGTAIKFDYFFESSAVISPEDAAPATRRVMVIT